jgi:hypothetical protein
MLNKIKNGEQVHLPGISLESGITFPYGYEQKLFEYCHSNSDECISFAYLLVKNSNKYSCEGDIICLNIESEIRKLDYLLSKLKKEHKLISYFILKKVRDHLYNARNAYAIIDNGIFVGEPEVITYKKQFNIFDFVYQNLFLISVFLLFIGCFSTIVFFLIDHIKFKKHKPKYLESSQKDHSKKDIEKDKESKNIGDGSQDKKEKNIQTSQDGAQNKENTNSNEVNNKK